MYISLFLKALAYLDKSCSEKHVGHSFGWVNAAAVTLTSRLLIHSYTAIS